MHRLLVLLLNGLPDFRPEFSEHRIASSLSPNFFGCRFFLTLGSIEVVSVADIASSRSETPPQLPGQCRRTLSLGTSDNRNSDRASIDSNTRGVKSSLARRSRKYFSPTDQQSLGCQGRLPCYRTDLENNGKQNLLDSCVETSISRTCGVVRVNESLPNKGVYSTKIS